MKKKDKGMKSTIMKKIILIHNELISNYIDRIDTLIMPYRGKVKALFQFIDTIENSTRFTQIVIHTDQLFQLWLDFKSLLSEFQQRVE